MDATDRLIRTIYALSLDEEWNVFRIVALEQATRQLGAVAGAWLTQPDSQPGEFTAWPPQATATASELQALGLKEDRELSFSAEFLPGSKTGVGMRCKHLDSGLSSRVAFAFASGATLPAAGVVARIGAHLGEAYAQALQLFIRSDERLSRWGRANRGTAAIVDARGVIYAATKAFRELLGTEFGDTGMIKLPFTMPQDTGSEHSSFGHGTLRFRVVRANPAHFLLSARKAQPLDDLSPREQEIARALSTGKTFKSVARQCGIATSTVANHASRIYRKLGIYRREELFEMIRRGQLKENQRAA